MPYLSARHDPWIVALSLLIATFAAYVALDLARRVRVSDATVSHRWVIAGSLVLGTGIWSMHFIGMRAFSLPIVIGYGEIRTFVSWISACTASAIGLSIASRRRLTGATLGAGSATMGAGICGMHYLGMAAIDLAPGIVWDWPLVALSVAIAVSASAAALLIFFWQRRLPESHRMRWQLLAAVAMGIAISGMHYTGMAAANFPTGAVCRTAGSFVGEGVIGVILLGTTMLLAGTLLTSIVDARTQKNAARLTASLRTANVRLLSADDQMRRQATLDPLTGLNNRIAFEDRLMQGLARTDRARLTMRGADDRLAVLMIDIDGFRTINDSLGHAGGDEVLCTIAGRIVAQARSGDTLARVGADQFLVMMEGVSRPSDCGALALRVGDAARAALTIAGRHVELSVSVGIVVYPDCGDRSRLLAQAEAAMRAAKNAGRGTWVRFEPHMLHDASAQLDLLNDLRRSIDLDQLELLYQPKIDGIDGSVRGVEALLRWHHPVRGTVSPTVFIPIAERFGFINAIGNWVIDDACRQMRAWSDAGLDIRVAINLSVRQLRESGLVDRFVSAFETHGVAPSQLLCEITESVAMQDIKATQRTLNALGEIGVFLSIDDFGTGYSSLSYLRQLPARQLKIDRSFIADLDESADARAVVDAVVRLAHALGLRVVAEGVETATQRDILIELCCDELQGYFFARPMSAARLVDWLAEHRSTRTLLAA